MAGAAGNSIGKVLQKKGTLILPPLSFKLKAPLSPPCPLIHPFRLPALLLTVIRGYALNRLWISGFLLDMCGAALMLTALSQAPVSVVQPIAGCGLAILCVFSHFYLKEVMNGLDWIAITMAGLGTIGVGVGGEEQKVEEIPLFSIPWLVLTVLILFVDSSLLLMAILFGLCQLRFCSTLGFISTKSKGANKSWISSVISKMGFVMSEMGFPKIVVPAAISCSVACSAVGFVYQRCPFLMRTAALILWRCTSLLFMCSGIDRDVYSACVVFVENVEMLPAIGAALVNDLRTRTVHGNY
ncbi:hypothetical protein TRIUR3_04137 [Triticum urartu]|uniref:Probable magnesium transporter n=1 Tax=Triticum urartu TaxID=4572 RepID=M8A1Y2_TRIUA|nr:hypothetical protein TRIUR3_04137 [Triticum urartu]